jgi:hypothetical protein
MVARNAGTSGPLRNGMAALIETSIVLECSGCRRVSDRTVTAWAEPGIPGLAVNRVHLHDAQGEAIAVGEKGWMVSHLTGVGRGASGVGWAIYESYEQAEAALRNLGALPVDWRLPADDPRFADPVLVALMTDCVDRAQALDLNLDLPGAEP